MKIKTTKYGEPILDIVKGKSAGKETDFGVYRDRCPDRDWPEIRQINMEIGGIEERTLNKELKQILLVDLAFVYGDTSKFTRKLMEFKII